MDFWNLRDRLDTNKFAQRPGKATHLEEDDANGQAERGQQDEEDDLRTESASSVPFLVFLNERSEVICTTDNVATLSI